MSQMVRILSVAFVLLVLVRNPPQKLVVVEFEMFHLVKTTGSVCVVLLSKLLHTYLPSPSLDTLLIVKSPSRASVSTSLLQYGAAAVCSAPASSL